MNPLGPVVTQFFEDEEWPLAEVEEGIYETAFEGDTGIWPCRAHVFEEDRRFVFVSAVPQPVPEDRRGDIGEFCHRANFGLAAGNFELDFDGGEVRFRTGVDAEQADVDVALVRNAVVANVMTMNRYLPGLQQVLAGRPPAEAVAEIEG